ncbi:class I SAM-dependent methyltransferase [Fulvimarina pelagi]|uniref:class I SAM-dependent methyltransferase n=1 Tax=Fulvimarina pelagi TaxID=217511 RepID=UPI0003088788|nr:class I SAM-dependent methyltransferase [Fulvimarina pelagi]
MKNANKPNWAEIFDADLAAGYDKRNSPLAPLSDCLHFLVRLVLADLPLQARILCVGAGTGAEILSLARAYPTWSFVGVDPSAEMLKICGASLNDAGVSDRCDLVCG